MCFYLLHGRLQKGGFNILKAFMMIYAIHLLTGIYGMVIDFDGSSLMGIWVCMFTITFANVLMLFIPENLGKKKTTVISAVNVCMWTIYLIHHLVQRPDFVFSISGAGTYMPLE